MIWTPFAFLDFIEHLTESVVTFVSQERQWHRSGLTRIGQVRAIGAHHWILEARSLTRSEQD